MAMKPPVSEQSSAKFPGADVPFGVNEVRLSARQWLAALGIVLLVALLVPWVWPKIERFETGPDYRIPYQLSKDYWLYERRLGQVADGRHILVLGDSVVWGEYVLPDGTLSHFLNGQAEDANRFVNVGVNGLFPLALEGLVRYYGKPLHHQKVVLQCNLLWMTSPKADLSTEKEEQFNHSRLVPQYAPRIPCYRADANERLSALMERNVPFVAWSSHLQNAYFGQKSILAWTLEDDGGSPPHFQNALKNPLSQITLAVPPAPPNDPQRGPDSPRHKPWFQEAPTRAKSRATGTEAGLGAQGTGGIASTNNAAFPPPAGTTRFEWVLLERSLQWQAFQRVVELLRERGNDVFVILGPFNEHLMAEDNRPAYRSIRDGVAAWLAKNQIPHLVPPLLPSELYADASHPLTDGYQWLAKRVYGNETFARWLN